MHRTRRGAAGDVAAVFGVRVVEEFGFAGGRCCVVATNGEDGAGDDRCDDWVCEPCPGAMCRRTDADAGAMRGASVIRNDRDGSDGGLPGEVCRGVNSAACMTQDRSGQVCEGVCNVPDGRRDEVPSRGRLRGDDRRVRCTFKAESFAYPRVVDI